MQPICIASQPICIASATSQLTVETLKTNVFDIIKVNLVHFYFQNASNFVKFLADVVVLVYLTINIEVI